MDRYAIDFHKIFSYNAETGDLIWKAREADQINPVNLKTWNTKYAGKAAGKIEVQNGRIQQLRVCYSGKFYMAHRIIWSMMKGIIPEGMLIDHIDGNPLNNRLDNLRLATRLENNRNRKRKSNSTHDLKGISFDKSRKKGWKAEIVISGKKKTIGRFLTKEEAHAAYCQEAEKEFKEFARFE